MLDDPQPLKKTLLRLLPLVVAVLPALIPFYLIAHNGVNMPYWDEWDTGFVDLAIKAHHGTLLWTDFTAPHNEHRIVIPKLVYLVLTWLTSWNEFALMYFGWAVACCTSLCIGVLCFKGTSRNRAIAQWFICNLLIFSITQWENWLAGYGMINFLPMMFITAGFVIAGSKFQDWPKVIVLVVLATAATFSSLQGFLAWPLLGILLAWPNSLDQSKKRIYILVVWTIAFGFNVLLYIIGYHSETPSQPAQEAMGLIGKVEFGLAYLGNPFFINSINRLGYAIAVGAMLLTLMLSACVTVVYLWRKDHDVQRAFHYLIWLLIGGYTLATALLAVIFRSSVGMQMALAGRYVTSTIYLPIALINLLPMMYNDLSPHHPKKVRHAGTSVIGTLLTCFVVVYMLSAHWGWKDADKAARERRKGKGDLLLIDPLPFNPLLSSYVSPNPERMVSLAREMNRIGYLHPRLISSANPLDFTDRDPSANSYRKYGAITELQPLSQYQGRAMIKGWAILPHLHRPASTVALSYQDQDDKPVIFMTALIGQRRPELEAVLGNSDYEFAGWYMVIPVDQFKGNAKTIRINAWAIDEDTGLAYKLDGQAEIHL